MDENLFNMDPSDGFNAEDHDIETDEIAKMYALNDMKESQKSWAKLQAEKFYQDFENLNVPNSISEIVFLIESKELKIDNVNLMLDNMISVFQETEDYEKCNVCLQIKTGVNDRI